jgi:PAS domain S-box-containing protein
LGGRLGGIRGSLEDTFPGASAMSGLMRAHDWAATPLGPPELWPEGLKVPLRMMLTSRFEMWLGWGPDLAFFYNDAYAPTLGVKHPAALGRPVRDVWSEIYAEVEGRFNAVMQGEAATWDKALLLILERSGYPEETYHTFSYSPLRGDSGAVEGLMCVVSEETERVVSERRLRTLSTLGASLLSARTRGQVVAGFRAALGSNTRDFPFCDIRLFDDVEGLAPVEDEGAAPFAEVAWPLAGIRSGEPCVRTPLEGLLADPPRGAWDVPPREALIVPIAKASQASPGGALILGLNPLRRDDGETVAFAQLIAGQVAGALSEVDALLAEAAETERLRALFEQSPSIIAVLRGPEHRFELVNRAYLRLIGDRDVIGRNVRDAVPEVVGQGFFELLDQVFATGEPFVGSAVPIMIQRTPGAAPEPRRLDFVYQPLRAPDGTVSGIFVEGVDVTETQEAIDALRESEQQFRTLAEAMPNHVWTSRPDGQLDWFNSRVYEYSGAAAGELDGEGWTAMVHPEDLPASAAQWSAALASGATYETEFRLRRADGVWRWHIARAIPLRSDRGAIVRWVGTNTDIEDQKASAAALADLNATLERQVAERTGELMATEAALRQSQKMEAVGQLTGGIAHDFNNLLTGITASLELLQTRIDQGRLETIPRYIDAAQSGAQRAAALTQRLLAFSRQQTLDPKPTSANRLIAGMEDLLRRAIGPNIEMRVVADAELWATLIDRNQLENALLNLCINARDAMPDGGRLTIETSNITLGDAAARAHELAAGDYVSLCVTDTGAGMTPEVIARAFDPFFTTKPLGQGTGLGLSMIYGFVRQSGGAVRIASEPGRGATLCLYLPRHFGDAETAEPRPRSLSADLGASGETILVIDDEPTVRMLLLDTLRDAGYAVIEAADGPSGLARLQSATPIDLLISDVGLPGGMNGRQIADAGRRLRPALKVLFITGYAEKVAIGDRALDPRMEVITKPFAIDDLRRKVRAMLAA